MALKRSASSAGNQPRIRSTTVVCVRRGNSVVMAADGQVTLGENVIKHTARKIRRLYNEKILAGFAGSTADAFSLFARFEAKLEQYHGNLGRAAVELAKEWRTDKMLRHLEALLLVADPNVMFLISGAGDVIEPDGGVAAIGSGGSYALAAARALMENTDLPARKIAEEAMKIAGKICIFTNENFVVEELAASPEKAGAPASTRQVMAGYSGTPLVQKIGAKAGHRVILRNDPATFLKDLGKLPRFMRLGPG